VVDLLNMTSTRKAGKEKGRGERVSLAAFFKGSKLNWLLVFVPVSLVIYFLAFPKLWLFIASALGIVPLAGLIGQSTEELASRVGAGAGGLLNVTFGNAPELIIGFFALQSGLQQLVKASISGSIIGNVLLVLGLSMFAGGWRRDKQTFSRTNVGASSAMLFLATVALVMPALFSFAIFGSLQSTGVTIEDISLLVAVVLMASYLASLVFSLKTHRAILAPSGRGAEKPRLSLASSVILLFLAMAIVAVLSELLVESIAEAVSALGLTQFFVGVVIVAVIGNAPEHASAVVSAKKDSMDLSVTISIGSATQIALFVGPVLVFVSFFLGSPMSFVFNAFEIAGIALSVASVTIVALDGESNWFEGVQLLAVYLILVIVFFFVP
jgi:Ca2+:H+ antiporter